MRLHLQTIISPPTPPPPHSCSSSLHGIYTPLCHALTCRVFLCWFCMYVPVCDDAEAEAAPRSVVCMYSNARTVLH